MAPSLLETVWFSEKRRNLLLLLLDGKKDSDEIKESLGVNWRSLILPLKELKEDELIVNNDRIYELSVIGRLIAETVKPMEGVLNLFEGSTEYWTNRDLTMLPQDLRDRIGEIEDCTLIEPDLNHMFEPPKQILNSLRKSNFVFSVFSIYHPLYPPLYYELAKKGVSVSLIVTEPVLERILEDCKKENKKREELQNIEVFLYKTKETGVTPPSIITTDLIFVASFFNLHGKFDHRDLMSFTESSMKWGGELFEYYKLHSSKITDP